MALRGAPEDVGWPRPGVRTCAVPCSPRGKPRNAQAERSKQVRLPKVPLLGLPVTRRSLWLQATVLNETQLFFLLAQRKTESRHFGNVSIFTFF